jgi:hypothetical protein
VQQEWLKIDLSNLKHRLKVGTASLFLVFTLTINPVFAGGVGPGSIVLDPTNLAQNVNQVTNSLTQIGQLTELISKGALTIENLLRIIQLTRETISGIDRLKQNVQFLLSGNLFRDYQNYIASLFKDFDTTVNTVTAFSGNAQNLRSTTDGLSNTETPTGQEIDSTLMNGQEGEKKDDNYTRLQNFTELQVNVQLPNVKRIEEEVLAITYKMRCQTDNFDTLPDEIKQICIDTGLKDFNIPQLTESLQRSYKTLQTLETQQQENGGLEGANDQQNAAFTLQVSNVQRTNQTNLENAKLVLDQTKMILEAKLAELQVARSSIERTQRYEDVRAISSQLGKLNALQNEFARSYAP